jgi:hypothetical protein
MEILTPLVTLIVLAGLEAQAGDYPSTPNPIQSNYTLQIVTPAGTNWLNMKAPPATTNLPAKNLSAMTNGPATNQSAILSPPTGLHVQGGN